MSLLRNNNKRANNAIKLLGFLMILEILTLLGHYAQGTFLTADLFAPADAKPDSMRQVIISLVRLVVRLGALVYFIQWFRRAYYNLYLTRVLMLNYKESSAAWSWFIPIFNFIRPYQIMREIWEKTVGLLQRDGQYLEGRNLENWRFWINLWWLFWVGAAIMGAASRPSFRNATVESLNHLTDMRIIHAILKVVSLGLTIYIIKLYRPLEQKLYDWGM